ncbi:MAG: zinc-dependent alcohol dehydrogenase [Promethearchaeota archaeon]|jgi:threonine dehydrogenase-like Zn-dependent dehydrogenase
MKALVFNYRLYRLAFSRILGTFYSKGYLSKLGSLNLKEISFPKLKSDNWLIVKTKYCGICGSDMKQIFLDGNYDNPITALISWPQILGHEAVGIVDKTGKSTGLNPGDRIALNPWVSCEPREIEPICSACEEGNKYLCRNFTKGLLTPGIHTGNSSDATGGFAEYFPAHKTMAIKIPDAVSFKQAVLADPFSVVLHSILKVNLWEGSICGVYGCGNLGLITIHFLKSIYKDITVIAIARFTHQVEMAKKFGADLVIKSSPPSEVIEHIGDYLNCDIYYLKKNKPWLIEGIDFLFDTVASAETLETGLRFVKSRTVDLKSNKETSGAIVLTGVHLPKRFEWTPWYFKEINIIGSNAFAIEDFEGFRYHAYHHYFRLLEEGRIDPTPIISHKFPLNDYKNAFFVARKQEKFKSIKVEFNFGQKKGD